MATATKKEKLQTLCEIEGFDSIEQMLEQATFDSVAPGICKNPDCDYSCNVEPDSDSGYCEDCEENTVVSCLMLAGII